MIFGREIGREASTRCAAFLLWMAAWLSLLVLVNLLRLRCHVHKGTLLRLNSAEVLSNNSGRQVGLAHESRDRAPQKV
ncbi:hypothetical protein Mapa_005641 [Marchantia paleacea]|nr:hypothetical protein Mapa_005641 [Marchantia paleacea]